MSAYAAANHSPSSYVPSSRGRCGLAGRPATTRASVRWMSGVRTFWSGLAALTNARLPSVVTSRSAVPGENPPGWETAETTGPPSTIASIPARTGAGSSSHPSRTP